MIGLLAILGALGLQLCMYLIAFPEITIYLFFTIGILFPMDGIPIIDTTQGAAQMEPFEVLYPMFRFINNHILPWHPALRLLFIVGCLAIYILLIKLVHIKGIYLFQFAGVILVGYLAYQVMSKGFLVDMIWSVVITIIITVLAAGLRYSVINPSD
ncbi:hypothetical protein P7D43_18765 [Enterococcus avium]|uniref:Uncharacterized protein n=1 Tax=Enterococcus avium TaxID=33945 RepID=A0AAW8RWP2_ENTAV|nr:MULTISPECIES: hypothetical protein [Enterococcus]MDT2404412.1 hypothetical protein [Enterococcus avium]MDT2434280.1 hypothetical protein [Enterococcus avium]MDT2468219.1 hypothetical protein [Enterococcus avium]MDT2485577.1 hypothetical protein [Enterococcus avium]MDT2507627.1 hypothetical protein [Enterococcus avium]